MIDFILARYNYWIVIILMLTGLYIVYSRGNLVKTVIGLNVFQTSVFIFYITLGKVAAGTAPILLGGHGSSDGHHGPSARGAGGHGESHDVPQDDPHGTKEVHETSSHADTDISVQHHTEPMSEEEALEVMSGEMGNTLEANEPGTASEEMTPRESLHDFSEVDASNSLVPQMPETHEDAPVEEGITLTPGGHESAADAGAGMHDAGHETLAQTADVIYSNPLPHVLILTAIVVGVATTAVGLALAVRIREAYGTIEEDALERMDNEAATGSPTGEGGKA